MIDVIKIAVSILVVVILVSALPTFHKEITTLITISCSIVILLYTTKEILPAIEEIKSLLGQVTFDGINIVFKAIGIGLVTQFVADICLDNGNKALANQMIFVGRIAILLSSLPIFIEVFKIIGQLTV